VHYKYADDGDDYDALTALNLTRGFARPTNVG